MYFRLGLIQFNKIYMEARKNYIYINKRHIITLFWLFLVLFGLILYPYHVVGLESYHAHFATRPRCFHVKSISAYSMRI